MLMFVIKGSLEVFERIQSLLTYAMAGLRIPIWGNDTKCFGSFLFIQLQSSAM